METTEIRLWIAGKPQGKQRARHGNGRTFTPKQTELAEALIVQAWRDAGEPRFPSLNPKVQLGLKLDLLFLVERPDSHYNSQGLLNAEGERHPLPENKKPDLDNAQKLVMDALNGRAYKDDVQVTDSRQRKRWSNVSGTEVIITLDEDREIYDR